MLKGCTRTSTTSTPRIYPRVPCPPRAKKKKKINLKTSFWKEKAEPIQTSTTHAINLIGTLDHHIKLSNQSISFYNLFAIFLVSFFLISSQSLAPVSAKSDIWLMGSKLRDNSYFRLNDMFDLMHRTSNAYMFDPSDSVVSLAELRHSRSTGLSNEETSNNSSGAQLPSQSQLQNQNESKAPTRARKLG